MKDIELMPTWKPRHGEESSKRRELFIYNQRRQMKDTGRAIHYVQSRAAEGGSLHPYNWGGGGGEKWDRPLGGTFSSVV